MFVINFYYYSNSDSIASPDRNDIRSPSEVSSGIPMDTADKLPSPSDSGTVSPGNELNCVFIFAIIL